MVSSNPKVIPNISFRREEEMNNECKKTAGFLFTDTGCSTIMKV